MENRTINNFEELQANIATLKDQQQAKEQELRQTINASMQSLDQTNIVKSMIQQIASDTNIKKDLVKIGIGLGLNYIRRKINMHDDTTNNHPLANFLITQASNFVNKSNSELE